MYLQIKPVIRYNYITKFRNEISQNQDKSKLLFGKFQLLNVCDPTFIVKPVDIAKPLQIHYNFVKYTLTTRQGSNDKAFTEKLNDFDFPPAEIFYHGIHALYRMVRMIDEPNLNFREISFYRKSDLAITDELIELYKETIDSFVEKLSVMTVDQLEEEIVSPLSGKQVLQKDWFAQNVMHTLHHVGQAVRLQGIVDRMLTNNPVEYQSASDYTKLF